MIILIDTEKTFDKIQQPFMIKALQDVSIEGIYFGIIKYIYDKPTANIVLSGKKIDSIYSKTSNKTKVQILSLFQHSCGSPSHSNQNKKK